MPSRAEQRRQTEERILAAAREIFAARGYDRTTVRAIATAARTDPGLVMRYYGSKQQLFAQATRVPPAPEPENPPPAELTGFLLAALHAKLADEPVELLAMLRSMLTHPDSAREVRDTVTGQQRLAAGTLDVEDADLRAALAGAILLGTVIGRYVLELDGLRDAPAEVVTRLLRPALESLLAP